MVQIVKQTLEERINMYSSCNRRELITMLEEQDKQLVDIIPYELRNFDYRKMSKINLIKLVSTRDIYTNPDGCIECDSCNNHKKKIKSLLHIRFAIPVEFEVDASYEIYTHVYPSMKEILHSEEEYEYDIDQALRQSEQAQKIVNHIKENGYKISEIEVEEVTPEVFEKGI